MKKILFNFLFTILIFSNLYAQYYIYDFHNLKIMPDTSINIFEISQNPSLMTFDFDDDRLNVSLLYNSKRDQIKRFLAPEGNDIYNIEFSGKKKINNNQIFKGYFAISKNIRKNWSWVFSKDYQTGNPFLLGDSSSGNSVFNGIYFSANYFNQLSNRLNIGAGLEYFVDEGLKNVSPKPTSQHRNISLRVGTSVNVLKNLKLGLSINAEDRKEEILYKEDKGSVYKEITLYKFRGFDLPVTIKKKTETRYSFFNGYYLSGDLIYNTSAIFQIYGNVKKGIYQVLQRDEISNPVNQGNFLNDYYKVKFLSLFSFVNGFNSIAGFEYFNSNFWSRHPEFYTVFSEGKQELISFNGNFVYDWNPEISFNAGAGFGRFKYEIEDYYSNIYFNLNSYLYSILTGVKIKLVQKIDLKILFLIQQYEPEKTNLDFSNPTIYFKNFFIKDFDFLSTELRKYMTGLSIKLNSTLGEFVFSVNYELCKAVSSSSWKNLTNSEIQSKLTYMVIIY